MADAMPLTKQDLQEALKNLATKDDLTAMETRFDGKLAAMESRLAKELKEYVHEGVEALEGPLNEVLGEVKQFNQRLGRLEQNTVSKGEFNELKVRVDAHHPLN